MTRRSSNERNTSSTRNHRSGSSKRGFAAMDPVEQREISRMGGRASHGGQGRDYESNEDRRGGRDYYDDNYSDYSRRNSSEGSSKYGGYEDDDDRFSGGRRRQDFSSLDRDQRRDNWGDRGQIYGSDRDQRDTSGVSGRSNYGGKNRDYDNDDDYQSPSSSRRGSGRTSYDDDDEYESSRH